MLFAKCLLLSAVAICCSAIQVKVAQGTLDGEQLALVTGDGNYYSFKGVPYAKPPLGELRFKPPEAPSNWTGFRDAKAHGSICYQYFLPNGSEDCLFLNVYTPPNLTPKTLYPVMVFFHGGGFAAGTGDSIYFSPDFLVPRDVILVTVNYRLEVLGFLSLQNSEVPGNNGMKDQVAALKWVQSNIKNFGGDPSSVTIFGSSSGGASVGYHIASPMSKGLFNRAILMSGTPFSDWARTHFPRRQAFLLGDNLGFHTNDDKELLKFLRATNVSNLINKGKMAVSPWDSMGYFALKAFGPVIETVAGPEGQFLPQSVVRSLQAGTVNNVEVIIGHVSAEGIIAYPDFSKDYDFMNRYAEYFITRSMAYLSIPEVGMKVGNAIKERYIGNGNKASHDTDAGIANFYSWSQFKFGINRFVSLLNSPKALYFYQFSAITERNWFGPQFWPNATLKGVCHNDDLPYIFHQPVAKLTVKVDSPSYAVIKNITTLWTNFAKTGNPTPDQSLGVTWLPFTKTSSNYLDIGTDKLSPGVDLDLEEYQFWDGLNDRIRQSYYNSSIEF